MDSVRVCVSVSACQREGGKGDSYVTIIKEEMNLRG